jgi:hypothetical protein
MKGKKHHGKHHHRDEGGRINLKAAGNPDVFKEAEGEESYAKGDERKKGGRVKKHVGHAEGKMAKHRRDHKHHRAKGGRVGSDRMPMSSAHHTSGAGDMAKGEPD